MQSLDFCAKTHCGMILENNEDAFLLEPYPDGSLLCAVCDGLGGSDYGEVASALGIEAFSPYTPACFPRDISDYITRANRSICAKRRSLAVRTMGTTVAALSIADGMATVFNVGDSRVYLLRNHVLRQLSRDHADFFPTHRLKADGTAVMRRSLTQHLGIPESEMLLEAFSPPPFPLQSGDRLLLCSDGLSDMVPDEAVSPLLEADAHAAADALLTAALTAGGTDNVTALVIAVR